MLCLHGAAGVAALRVSGVCYVCIELLCGSTQSFWSVFCLHGAAGVVALRVSGVCYVCMELLV